MEQTLRGIVLHTLKYNDSSQVVDIFTESLGRLSFLVPVSRSRRSGLSAALFQPLSQLEFVSNVRPTALLQKMREAKPLALFTSIPYEPRKTAIVLFLAEFLSHVLRHEGENRPLFAYFLHSIQWLDTAADNYASFHLVFLLRLSQFLGLRPNLEGYRHGDFFDLRGGCFVHGTPVHPDHLTVEESSRLRSLMRMNYDTIRLFPMSRTDRRHCLDIALRYYRLHLPTLPPLRSLAVLQELF